MIKELLWQLYKKNLSYKYGSNSGIELLASEFRKDYKLKKRSFIEIYKIHKKGFTITDWNCLTLDTRDYSKYLNSGQYYSMHPINGRYSKWIDDKLTLKYLCSGTELDKYLPKYYYQIDASGKVLSLVDSDRKLKPNVQDVLNLLKEKKELAVKQVAGSIGEGFYKFEYDGSILVNGTTKTEDELFNLVKSLKNYLIIEYLKPHKELAKYCSNVTNTIRYLTGKDKNENILYIKGFVRFGTNTSGYVENYNAGGVLCYLDENGRFSEGNLYNFDKNINTVINEHPDSKEVLNNKIPMWNEIVEATNKFSKHFPQMKYLGYDFVVTDKNEVKILEINSLTSLDSFQVDKSIFDTKNGYFFKELMNK